MIYKAKVSFAGMISMAEGEVREISDSSLAEDLLHAGYIEEIVSETKEEIKPKAKKKSSSKKK